MDYDWTSNSNRVPYFAPLTLIGMRLPGAPSADFVIQVMLEQTYYFTFRNPKYGGSANASTQSVKHIPATMRARADTRSLASEQDAMEDAGGLDDEDAAAAAPLPHNAKPHRSSSIMVKTLMSIYPLPSNENSMKFR